MIDCCIHDYMKPPFPARFSVQSTTTDMYTCTHRKVPANPITTPPSPVGAQSYRGKSSAIILGNWRDNEIRCWWYTQGNDWCDGWGRG